jgi:hypothetical protein
MSGEVETSQAEVDLTAPEDFLGGTRISNDLRLCSTTSTSSGPPDGTGMAMRTRGAKEYRILKGSSKTANFTISRKCGVKGDTARLSSHLHLHGWLLR